MTPKGTDFSFTAHANDLADLATLTVKYGPKSHVADAALFQKTAVSLGRRK